LIETRVYYAILFANLVVSRMITGYLSAREKLAATQVTPLPGVNPHSVDWKEVYNQHRAMGDGTTMTFDNVNFDQHNQYSITVKVGQLIARDLVLANTIVWHEPEFLEDTIGVQLCDELFHFLYVAATIMSCSGVHVNGTVAYYDPALLPSGADRTSSNGSNMQALKVKRALLDVIQHKGVDLDVLPVVYLRENTAVSVYGDDQMVTNRPTLAEIVSPYEFASAYCLRNGGVLTCPDKSPITPDTPYQKLSEAVLLQRKFRVENGHVFAPLDRDSIEQCLFWVKGRKNAQKNLQDTIRNVMFEAAMHGRQYYDDLGGVVSRACFLAKVPYNPFPYETCIRMVTEQ
jgi:hypothetical protein